MNTPERPEALNGEVELICKANAFDNPLFPTQGFLLFGDAGIEFQSGKSNGFAQIPWANVDQVRADVYGDYVRGIDVVTDGGLTLPFVLSDGAAALRCIRDHVGRERMSSGGDNWSRAAKHDKSRLSRLFHGRSRPDDGGPRDVPPAGRDE